MVYFVLSLGDPVCSLQFFVYIVLNLGEKKVNTRLSLQKLYKDEQSYLKATAPF